jgi:hypothetical protein
MESTFLVLGIYHSYPRSSNENFFHISAQNSSG